MLHSWRINKVTKICFPLLFAWIFLTTLCYASPLSEALDVWNPVGLQGEIMEIVPMRGYIIVQEKKVILVDTTRTAIKYKTKIENLHGNTLTPYDLSKGDRVFAKGGAVVEDNTGNLVIVAKEIYLLPESIEDEQMMNNEIFHTPPSPW